MISWIDSTDYEPLSGRAKLSGLKKYDGLLVPGGFGERGIEGKIKVIEYARQNKIPNFGLCYGMQLAVIEFSRNALGLKEAHTTEINPQTKHPVIDIMPGQKKNLSEKNYGATMRLGAYKANLKKGTVAQAAYGADTVNERHRHRYEVNPDYVKKIEEKGGVFSAVSPDGVLMEIFELPKNAHPFFLGTQFHPEFKSTPLNPHPLFVAFIKAAIKRNH